MKNKLLIILAILFLSAGMYAQSPGFMGKTWQIYYDASICPALITPNVNYETGLLSMNVINGLTIQKAITRNKCIGLTYQFFNTSMSAGNKYIYYTYFDPAYNEYRNDEVSPKGFMDVSVYCIGANIRFYTSNWISPLGRYVQLDANLLNYSVSGIESLQYPSYITKPIIKNNGSYKKFCATLTLGKERVIFKRVLINYGLRTGLVFTMPTGILNPENHTTESDFISRRGNTTLFYNYLLSFNIGIGLLL